MRISDEEVVYFVWYVWDDFKDIYTFVTEILDSLIISHIVKKGKVTEGETTEDMFLYDMIYLTIPVSSSVQVFMFEPPSLYHRFVLQKCTH